MDKREIRFRAWLGNTMEQFDLEDLYQEDLGVDGEMLMGSSYLGGELMQYTGLKDASGKEIYEGDIVEFNQCRDERGYVWISLYNDFRVWAGVMEFQDGRFHIAKSIYLRKASAKITMGNADKKKIIGNIYENPELLKTAKG